MDSPGTSSFAELLTRIADGSEDAVWELINRYSKNILRAVRRSLANDLRQKVDSVDIVQSVWKSLLAKDEILDGIQTPNQFMAYIGQMAIYKVYELNRHFRQTASRDISREVRLEEVNATVREDEPGTRAFLPVDATAHCPDEIAEARERWQESLAACGERATKIVALKLQRASDDQIGQTLGVSPETVRREVRGILERFHA